MKQLVLRCEVQKSYLRYVVLETVLVSFVFCSFRFFVIFGARNRFLAPRLGGVKWTTAPYGYGAGHMTGAKARC